MSVSPPASVHRAVFLSYASQDAEAAKRIGETLRKAGVEVWLDLDALVGGDTWDAKIREQIGSCALFLAIISANTQARAEGYFRLEWKLAAQRTHRISERTAFLLPVVIDATRDPEADVPTEFRTVQWTRLPGGDTPPAFVSRVQKLLAAPSTPVAAAHNQAPSAVINPAAKSGGARWLSIVLAAAVVTLATVVALRPTRQDSVPSTKPGAAGPSAATPFAAEKSLAVLPFTNLSDDRENAYFADGVHDDLLSNLSALTALKVVSRTSVMQYRPTTKTIRQIAGELGVNYVLEGSVRRVGGTVRLTSQLIRAATDEHLWAKTYDRDLRDIFAVQSDLAREIAGALHAVLSPAEAAALDSRPTQNIEAYESFQKARLIGRSNANAKDRRKEIIPLLERAIALDPDYAAAWVELSRQHFALFREERTPARQAQAKDALAHAERLAPNSFAVLLAGYDFGDRDTVNERRKRILELFPDRTESHLIRARDAQREGRWLDRLESFRSALQQDPRNVTVLHDYFFALHSMRRWDEAEAVGAKIAEIDPDDWEVRLVVASMAYGRNGSTAQLTRLLADHPRSPEAAKNTVIIRSRIAILLGDWQGIVALWREVGPETFRTAGPDRVNRFVVAGAFIKLGDPDSARPLLEQNREELLSLLQKNDGDVSLWTDLCVVRGMLNDRAGARAALDQAAKIIEAKQLKPLAGFAWRWDYALARSWVDGKSEVIAEIGRLLREPTPKSPTQNIRVVRTRWSTMPLHGDPEFEAMLNDPQNNAPLF